MTRRLVSAPWVLPIVSEPVREGAVLLDDSDTIIAVGTRVALRREHRMRLPDAIIWATAQDLGVLLVTRNSRDFPSKDPGVRIPYPVI